MGIGRASGENRTVEATKMAISSPLLEVSIDGAKQVLLNITGGPDLTLFEAQDASEIVSTAAGEDVNIIFGTAINPNLGDEVVVTVIATGIDDEAEAAASKQLPGRGHQVSAPREKPAAPKILTPEEPAPAAPVQEAPVQAEEAKPASPVKEEKPAMMDPISVWGLNDDDYSRRQNPEEQKRQSEEKEAALDADPSSAISQIDINTDYDDDDDDDIPFFKHRRDR